MRAMIVKEFRELVRDRRTLGLLIMMPLLLLVIFGYAANFYVSSVKTAVVGPQTSQVAGALPSFFNVTVTEPSGTQADAETLLRDNKADVAFVTGKTPVLALVNGSNLFAAQSTVAALNKAGDKVRTQVLYNPGLKTSWVMVPAIIGLILTFIGTIITSIGMVREREAGTLEQLAVMPIKPSRVILGKIAPYFLVASLDMVIVTVLGIVLFGVPFNGNPFAFALGAAIFLFVTLGLGVFISTISQTAGQAIQTAFFFLLPQILLSGMIFPLEAMAAGVRWIGYLLPLTYFTMISQGIMLRGAPITSLWLPFVVLTVMAIVVFTGATLRFRRDLAPGSPTSPAHKQPAAAGEHCVTYAVRSATVRFGRTLALDDVTVEVPAGSVVAVVGGDGAGKSTLLRALAGEVPLDAGTVEAPPRQRLGYLPASAGSWAALTATQNIDFVAGIYGLAGDALTARRRELLDRASLTSAADRPAAKLSGGMRRKLGFTMAIVHRPDLLILDEPSTGIDPVSRIDLWRLASEAAASGAAVLMSTTYLDEAERAANLVVLDGGRILVQGSYDQVRAGFAGVITQAGEPVRSEWAWRRGRVQHEYWPTTSPPPGSTTVPPDLEDIVIALSLARRNAVVS